jgi:hypothetical protein
MGLALRWDCFYLALSVGGHGSGEQGIKIFGLFGNYEPPEKGPAYGISTVSIIRRMAGKCGQTLCAGVWGTHEKSQDHNGE